MASADKKLEISILLGIFNLENERRVFSNQICILMMESSLKTNLRDWEKFSLRQGKFMKENLEMGCIMVWENILEKRVCTTVIFKMVYLKGRVSTDGKMVVFMKDTTRRERGTALGGSYKNSSLMKDNGHMESLKSLLKMADLIIKNKKLRMRDIILNVNF